MERPRREFLEQLLSTPSPSGFETRGQRVWVDYVSEFADEVRTDAYGNAVAVAEGDEPAVAFTGHADEIGLIVNNVDDSGYVHVGTIGGSDKTVTQGQHVEIHTDDGPVGGVIGQTAIHLRDRDDDGIPDIDEQHVDIGADDGEEASELVDVGDPITIGTSIEELRGSRLTARGMDNRIGTWAAAEGLRRAVEADVGATVYAVSTVQEEVGKQGAEMVGFDLDVDAALAVDVTHATDSPNVSANKHGDIELGGGPVIARGSSNHPQLVREVRSAADSADIPVQLQASGNSTGTDADAFYTSQGGIPALNVGLPNRYMHTPVEIIDTDDLTAVADLLATFADEASGGSGFAADV